MLLIQKGRVIDPGNNIDEELDIFVDKGKIVATDKKISCPKNDQTMRVINAAGLVVVPGLIDMHTHLREPGGEDKETIESGCRAAARGGFTSIACMPNTDPVNDNRSVTRFIISRAQEVGIVNVFPVGSITKGEKGEFLSEIGELKMAGCVAISDDGRPVMNSEVMRRALEYASMFNLPVISHCEDLNLAENGVMNEGFVSACLGLKGIPAAAEEVMVARDIILSETTGARIHIAHVSTSGSIKLIREAKKRGVNITCEVTPHHFSLTEEAVKEFDTNAKINPPLRSKVDVLAIKEGLRDDTIDVIATDHAPHSLIEKEREFDYAPFGITGLETAASLALNELVDGGVISLTEAIIKMSLNPAAILGLNKGSLKIGSAADITILDLKREEIVDPENFQSRAKNSPFIGRRLKGIPVVTIVKGEIVWEKE